MYRTLVTQVTGYGCLLLCVTNSHKASGRFYVRLGLNLTGMAVRYFFTLLVLLSFPLCVFAEDIPNVSVSSVTDGDTFKVNLLCGITTLCKALPVRVQGVDTPEFKTKDPCEKKRAKEAKLFTRQFLNSGVVSLLKCKRDKYFRLLCDVTVTNTETKEVNSLSAALLNAGLAVEYNGNKKHKYNWCGPAPVRIK